MLPTTSALGDRAPFIPSQSYSRLARCEEPCVVESCSADMWAGPTAGCIDTGLPAGRRYFGQSDKPLVETANVHHARWVMFTETAVGSTLAPVTCCSSATRRMTGPFKEGPTPEALSPRTPVCDYIGFALI